MWKTKNNLVFRNETPNPGSTLIRAKKVSAERHIRHKLTQSFHPPTSNQSAVNRKKTHWIS